MRPRTAAVLLTVAFLLGGFVALTELRDTGDRAAGREAKTRLFPGVEADRIDAIEIAGPDAPLARAERGEDGWRLVEPLRFEGDDAILDGMAATLSGLVAEARIEPRGSSGLGEFGLEPAQRELRFRAGDEWRSLRIGRRTPVGGNTYVTLDDAGEVFSVATWRTNALARSQSDLRNHRVLHFDPPAVSRLRARWPGGGVTLERREQGWWLIEPVEARADADTVDRLLSDLSFLRAEGFVDEPASPVELGLEEPAFALALSGAGLELDFALGAERGQGRVARGTGGVLYEVASEHLEELPREFDSWRDKSLARFEPADAGRLEIAFAERTLEVRNGASGWQDEAGSLGPQRVAELIAELARLTAADIVAESLGDDERAGLGLAPPRVRFRVFARAAGEALLADVSLGVGDPERGAFAQRAGSPQIFRLAPELAEQLPGSHADWQARFTAAADDEAFDEDEAEPLP